MDQNDWNRIETILDNALTLPENERRDYINEACEGDTTLITEIMNLLKAIHLSEQTHFLQDISSENHALLENLASENEERSFIGRQIGAFEIVEKIGTGGMGSVFRATRADGAFKQQVAIKLLRQGFYSEDILKRFRLERQILANLSHPHIGRLYDGGVTHEGTPYLVMEYIDGLPIDKYCDHHSLSIPERLRLFKDICKAVAFAHRNLVIHRDLKAENIYVDSSGLVKILDFGIAKLLNPKSDFEKMIATQAAHEFWSPHYAAPEQTENGPITTATDVYSLGILLHKLITNRFPFHLAGKNLTQIKSIIHHDAPDTLSQSLSHASSLVETANRRNCSINELHKIAKSDLSAIVSKSIRKLPEYRYNSVAQFVDDITKYQHNLPVSARKNSIFYRANKFYRRYKKGILSSAGIFLLILGLISYYTFQLSQKRDEAQAEANKAKSVTSFLIELFDASDPTQAHGKSVTAQALLQRGINRAKTLKNQPEVQNQMLETIGRVYRRLGQYNKSHTLLLQVLNKRKKKYGIKSLKTAGSLDHFGMLLIDEGSFRSAESLLRQALHTQIQLQGAHNPDVATSQNLLAYALRRQGKYDEAERLYRSSLKIRRAYFGDNNPLTIASMSSLATVLHNKGAYKTTEKLFRNVLAWRRKMLGPTHPDLAMSLNNLGALLMNRGKYKEAKKFLDEALQMRKKIYGSVHPKVALTMNNLAIVMRDTGDLSAAEALFKQALKMRIKLLGNNHVATALSKFGLGELMLRAQRPDTALILFEQSKATFTEKLSINHSFTARTEMDIGSAQYALGYPDQAKEILISGFEKIKKIHPDSSLERALAEQKLGIFYFDQKKFIQAYKILTKACRTLQYIEGKGSIRQQRILCYLDKIKTQPQIRESTVSK